MNVNTGQLYPSLPAALAALGPGESPLDVVEIHGDPTVVDELSRSIQQMRAIERRRAANRQARKSRRRNHP